MCRSPVLVIEMDRENTQRHLSAKLAQLLAIIAAGEQQKIGTKEMVQAILVTTKFYPLFEKLPVLAPQAGSRKIWSGILDQRQYRSSL